MHKLGMVNQDKKQQIIEHYLFYFNIQSLSFFKFDYKLINFQCDL